ncbi:MAG: ABC transporter permease [Candidatus Lernaella stagnicola]|nr:ABC transporter permease [Candidatus Lernaella stagnicola]
MKTTDFLQRTGHKVADAMAGFGRVISLGGQTIVQSVKPPYEISEIFRQVQLLGVESISIALLTAFFTGMVFALQFAVGLDRFGGKEYVSVVTGIAFLRELGPVLCSVVVGSRVGSGIAAELGSMAVTEQIDAIRALGSNPVKKLVVPRMWAMLIALPSLAMLADVVGIAGGMVVGVTEVGLSAQTYLSDTIDGVGVVDLITGLIKTYFFAVGIVLIACHNGMTAYGGTEGVGQATTKTVVGGLIYLFLADFFLTRAMIPFG